MLYDYKMKVIFNLKSGKKNELLLNLIFPETDGNGDDDGSEDKNSAKEKETENSVSLSSGYSYTPVMVRSTGLEPAWSPTRSLVLRVCQFHHDRLA